MSKIFLLGDKSIAIVATGKGEEIETVLEKVLEKVPGRAPGVTEGLVV
jgi:hypothetical protein